MATDKIKYGNFKYKVKINGKKNEEESDVVCATLHGIRNTTLAKLDKICPGQLFLDALEIPDTIQARAKCKSTDAYDEAFGKKLAKKRLLKKLYDMRSKYFSSIRSQLIDNIVQLNNEISNLDFMSAKAAEEIDEMLESLK